MAGYLCRRIAFALLLLFLVVTVTFFLLHLAPGEPSLLFDSPRLSRDQRAAVREAYGFDRPLPAQYWAWLRAAAQGDWGTSFAQQRPVVRVLREALPNTLLLASVAVVLQYGAGLILGVAAARRNGRWGDHLIRLVSLVLYSVPVFWLALMAILVLCLHWPIFPASHLRSVGAAQMSGTARLLDLLHHLVLPSSVLALASLGGVTRFVRNSVLEALGQNYIRTARAKGLTERRVLWVHALRNAVTPLTQVFGLHFPQLLNGALVVEVIFAWPGVGRLTYDAILARDYPLILASAALSAVLVLVGNLLADLLHAAAQPLVRDA